jgi:hypothetical protein
MYRDVAEDPHAASHFELGRPLAIRLGYHTDLLERIPAGPSNPSPESATSSTSPTSRAAKPSSTSGADPA